MNNNQFVPQEILESRDAKLESDDSYKYEIDTQIFLERIYYFWIGYMKFDGEWVKDRNRKAVMSQELADILKNEIEYRVNTHSFLSEYDDEFIKKVSLESAIMINNTLMYDLEKYKLDVSDFRRLVLALKHIFMSLLRIAKNGGMRQYRTDKGKIIVNRQEQGFSGGI